MSMLSKNGFRKQIPDIHKSSLLTKAFPLTLEIHMKLFFIRNVFSVKYFVPLYYKFIFLGFTFFLYLIDTFVTFVLLFMQMKVNTNPKFSNYW